MSLHDLTHRRAHTSATQSKPWLSTISVFSLWPQNWVRWGWRWWNHTGRFAWAQFHQQLSESLRRKALAYSQRVLIEVGGFSFDHLDGHDPQRPDVHFGPVSFPRHHLRRHPVRGAHHGAALALLRSDLGTEAEVSWKIKIAWREKT